MFLSAASSLTSPFTGKERDAETGLDYFLARYYSGAQGRFLSVDPDNAGSLYDDPQSWNGYAYGRNNPLKYTDPSGLFYMLCLPSGGGCISNYPDIEFFYRFYDDPEVTLTGGMDSGSILVGGKVIGTYAHLADDSTTPMVKKLLDPEWRERSSGRADNASFELTAEIWSTVTGAKALWGLGRSFLLRKSEDVVLRQINKSISKNTIKHIVNRGHLAEFQRLSPSLSIDDVTQIGIKVAETGRKVGTNTFVKTMEIGGKQVTVKSVVNANNALRSVYVVQ
jgi:RHS repeat-associated protein